MSWIRTAFYFCIFMLAVSSRTSVIYYGGERNDFANVEPHHYGSGPQTQIFDDFEISTLTRITALFTEQLAESLGSTKCNLEIRKDLSPGNGGQLIFEAAEASCTITATGRVSRFGTPEYLFRSTDIDLVFSPGTYWFNIWPWRGSDLSQTTGLNGIGPTVGNNLIYGNSIFNTWDWTPVSMNVTMGVEGEPVPEPMSLIGIVVGVSFFRRSSKSA